MMVKLVWTSKVEGGVRWWWFCLLLVKLKNVGLSESHAQDGGIPRLNKEPIRAKPGQNFVDQREVSHLMKNQSAKDLHLNMQQEDGQVLQCCSVTYVG